MTGSGRLQRRLGLGDAVVIGAGSMVGAGVFAVWSPAAQAAGDGLLVALALAGLVAFCNATSSAQLAALHPESGGTYVYGRRQLGPAWGHLAGWGFVVGKTASCAAMALTVGAYLWPEQERLVAIGAVAAIVVVNLAGVSRTAAVTRVLLAVALVALVAVVVAGWAGDPDVGRIDPLDTDAGGVLRAAGFLFFAFAGYARIATLGEEVREPERTIPRAIPLALGGVLVLYAVVAFTALAAVPADALAATDAPLRVVAVAAGADGAATIVRVGAGIAALGVLLNLVPGVSRTVLAMARRRELPVPLAVVDEDRSVPLRAELSVAGVVMVLIAVVDLRDAIALSGVAVLTYYAITNLSALTLTDAQRRWPRPIAVAGLVGCVALVASLPPVAVAIGAAVVASGVVARRLMPGTVDDRS
ncbi:MAG: APC family permease [Actinomycetota bacterium]|nr:APC family permease [Actinomycetota bacterium]